MSRLKPARRQEFAALCTTAYDYRRAIGGTFAFFPSTTEAANGMHEDDPGARKQLARFEEEGQRAARGRDQKRKRVPGRFVSVDHGVLLPFQVVLIYKLW